MAIPAENYHLKWDSHLSFLNNSVANLYKNEKFADVVLYSSGGGNSNHSGIESIPTVGISAHKFILSSCSQFFATMFENTPIASPNGILYVVLPPDLSHRAIQILVQYMYSGEATVSNDILSEVLRGGEILKIRGLCRASASQHHRHHHHREATVASTSHYPSNCARPIPTTSTITSLSQLTNAHPNDLYALGKCNNDSSASVSATATRYTMEQHAQHQQQFRGIGASIMPKNSPVIIKSPKRTHMNSVLMTTASISKTHSSGISINKEVAIDPEDKCCYPMTPHEAMDGPQLPPPPIPSSQTICNEVGCNSCPMQVANIERSHHRSRGQSDSDEMPSNSSDLDYNRQSPLEHCENDDMMRMRYNRDICRSVERGERGYYSTESYDTNTQTNVQQYMEAQDERMMTTPPTRNPHNYLNIKQEPTDWSSGVNFSNEQNNERIMNRRQQPPTPIQSPNKPLDFKMPSNNTIPATIKVEADTVDRTNDDEQALQILSASDYDNYTHLACNLCKKSFDNPKIWMRHLQTHAASSNSVNRQVSTTSNTSREYNGTMDGNGNNNIITTTTTTTSLAKIYVPKKRRRVSQQENNQEHATLLCDLCTTSFKTVAEWVRHMAGHSDMELAIFNSKKEKELKAASLNASNTNNSNTNNNLNSTNSNSTTTSQAHHPPHKKYSNRSSQSYGNDSERFCDICNKKFSSHSGMMLHKRNHHSGNSSNISNTNSNGSSLSSPPVSTTIPSTQNEQLSTTKSSE